MLSASSTRRPLTSTVLSGVRPRVLLGAVQRRGSGAACAGACGREQVRALDPQLHRSDRDAHAALARLLRRRPRRSAGARRARARPARSSALGHARARAAAARRRRGRREIAAERDARRDLIDAPARRRRAPACCRASALARVARAFELGARGSCTSCDELRRPRARSARRPRWRSSSSRALLFRAQRAQRARARARVASRSCSSALRALRRARARAARTRAPAPARRARRDAITSCGMPKRRATTSALDAPGTSSVSVNVGSMRSISKPTDAVRRRGSRSENALSGS